jgi:hypothetical protein
MRLPRPSFAVFFLPALLSVACGDNTPTYPAIVIYGNPDGTGNTTSTGATGASDGSGNASSGGSGNGTSSGGSGNDTSSGGMSSGGASAPTGLYAHCANPWSGEDPPVKTKCDLDALQDGGDITGDITANKTLKTGFSYGLNGPVRVMPGVTLTIQPCVKVIGKTADSVLAVLSGAIGDPLHSCFYASGEPGPGAKLMAIGEPMAPIVFTSSKPKGQRAPGDWGGVILMGNAQNNLATADDNGTSGTRVPIEGLTRPECHGWPTAKFNAESSGHLEYVRIEFASRQLAADNETNGLSLGSLGSGTELHYIEVSNSGDDCFEWFGGAANADHLIALNCDDDMFDGDNGFSGHLQFLFGRQFPTTTELDSRGFEIDGAPSPDNKPVTSEQASNFTICGGGATDHNATRDGAVLRNFAGSVSLMNGIITGFAGSGTFVQNDASSQAKMTFVNAFANAKGIMAGTDVSNGNASIGANWFVKQTGNTSAAADRFCDCWANPPVPVGGSTAKGGKPTGFADESADYVGAFKDASAGSNWMRGLWVDWSSK